LSKASGGGTLSGTLTGTIPTSGNSVTISTPVYSKSDTMTLTATATAGDRFDGRHERRHRLLGGRGDAVGVHFHGGDGAAGVASSSITVQRQDFFGNPNDDGATGVTLSSSSTGTKTFNPTSR
jgi:hypothetical protein